MSEQDYNAGWAQARIYYDPEYDESMEDATPPKQWSYEQTQKPRLRETMTTESNADFALREMRELTAKPFTDLTVEDFAKLQSRAEALDRQITAGRMPKEWVQDSTPEVARLKEQVDVLRKRLVAYGEFLRALGVVRGKLDKALEP